MNTSYRLVGMGYCGLLAQCTVNCVQYTLHSAQYTLYTRYTRYYTVHSTQCNNTVVHTAVQCSAVQCSAVQCSAVQWRGHSSPGEQTGPVPGAGRRAGCHRTALHCVGH
jgi:hypothetical protein